MQQFEQYIRKCNMFLRPVNGKDILVYDNCGHIFIYDQEWFIILDNEGNSKTVIIKDIYKKRYHCPKQGDMIARSSVDMNKQWLVPKELFIKNYVKLDLSDN